MINTDPAMLPGVGQKCAQPIRLALHKLGWDVTTMIKMR